MTGGDLEGLSEVETADVYKAGRLAATLSRTLAGVEFRYREDYRARAGPAVASTLPLSGDPVRRDGGALPAYFTGLLPEGRRLGALRRAVKTSADDELSLLLAVGADAIGDVQVMPQGVLPGAVPPEVDLARTDTLRFSALLADLGIRAQRSALPGVQDKTSAAMLNLPVARAGERYLLKLNPFEYPHLVENEAFFLAAARESGIPVPVSEVLRDADGQPGLLIRRFDRVTVDGQVRALAVEDGCQISGRPPADKYRNGTGPTFAALMQVCPALALAGRDLLRQLVFAYLTGNGDAHAKNFSVLQDRDGEWRVSPAYDLPSSYPYGDLTMALSINGRSGGDFGGRDFRQLGVTLGVPERAVQRVLVELTDRVDRWLPHLSDLPFDADRVRKLARVVQYRRQRLLI